MQTNLTTTILNWGLLRFRHAINRQTFGQNGWFFFPVWRGAGPQKSAVSYMILVHTFFFIIKACTVGMD